MNNLFEINKMIYVCYGSKKGMMRALLHRSLYVLGYYRSYKSIDWKNIERLVFVCKGNVCRSPYAEAVAKSLSINALSCGIDTENGLPANPGAVKTALINQIDLADHRARSIDDIDLGRADLVIAMEPWHIQYLKENKCVDCQYTLLGLWREAALPYIHDPYGLSKEYFRHCFDLIGLSVRNLAAVMKGANG